MEKYQVSYSEDAVQDLRDIFEYIAFELKEPGIAIVQARRIRDSIRRLDIFPARNKAVEWEPWHSIGMHQMSVDHFIVFYTVSVKEFSVNVLRIFYGKRDIQGHIQKDHVPLP